MEGASAKTVSPADVFRLLPKKNCGKCGTPTCMGFAVRLLRQRTSLQACPYLREAQYIQSNIALRRLLEPVLSAKKTRLVIHEDLCTGCANCVIVCPPNAILSIDASGGKGPKSDRVVTKVAEGRIIVVDLNQCRRSSEEDEEPCRLCIEACPFKAIEFL
jgi:4Fe-4S ferredoxin